MDARIGQLQTANGIVYYAYVNGYDKPEFRGTLEEVEVALGLREPSSMPVTAPVTSKKKTDRDFIVRIEWSYNVSEYGSKGYSVRDGYDYEVVAKDHAEAIKKAREHYKEVNFHLPAAKYSAKLK